MSTTPREPLAAFRLTASGDGQNLVVGPEAVPSLWQLLIHSTRRQRILLALACVAPVALAALFAWHSRVGVINEAHENAKRSVVALEQHAANALDSHALILRQVDLLTRGLTAEQIRNDQLLRVSLADFSRDPGKVSAIGVTDASGNLLTASPGAVVRDRTVADRDVFLGPKRAQSPALFVSEAFAAGGLDERHFALSLPRTSASGEFAGTIFTSIPLTHFTNFWRQFTPSNGYLVPMVRPDGALIVRYPRTDSPPQLDPRGPFISRLNGSPRGLYTASSLVDGVERVNAYSQVKDYPLYVSFSVETEAVLSAWQREAGAVAALGGVVSCLLAALWLAVVRQSHTQRLSAAHWERAARALEQQIALREQAQESVRSSAERVNFGNQLIGIVSHDLRNPLNTITLTAAVMARRGALEAQDAQLVQRIQTAADRAARLVGDLLDFTQARLRGCIPIQRRSVDLHCLLEGVVAGLEPAFPGRIALAAEAGDIVGDWDPDRLSQVVENLVTNALKYGAPEGVVQVRARLHEGQVVLEVHNDGDPIPTSQVARLFEPLQRGAQTSQPNPDRSIGIGLYIVKHIVDAHGGTMDVASTVAQGTTFTVHLPLRH